MFYMIDCSGLAIFNMSRTAQAAMTALLPSSAASEIACCVLDGDVEAETHRRRLVAEATRR